jgi:ubiquitin-conjugating enzyme E2 Q
MELLTNSGWSAVSTIESVLLQVRMAIASPDPPAHLEVLGRPQLHRDYGVREAMDAYIMACRAHQWEVPKDFKDFGMDEAGRV